MMNVAKKIVSVFGAAALALAVAGCSETAATGASGAGGDGAGTGSSSTRTQSPLNEILSQIYGTNLSAEEQQRQFAEQQMQREEEIARCMNELGFEYTPNPNSSTLTVADEGMWRPDDRDWVAQWGYGSVNSPWNAQNEAAATADPDLVDEQEWFDPNQELRESMSESEQQAWDAALWGNIDWENLPPEVAESTGDGGWMIIDNEAFNEMQGCNGRANNAVSTGQEWDIINSDEFRPLMDAINAMYESIWNAPEMTALDQEWVSCMADAGYPGFTKQSDASNSIWEAQSEIQSSIDWENWNWELGDPLSPANNPEIAALAEREIELALADLDCRESVRLRDRQEEFQFAIERQFINDHRADLDALLAAVQQGR